MIAYEKVDGKMKDLNSFRTNRRTIDAAKTFSDKEQCAKYSRKNYIDDPKAEGGSKYSYRGPGRDTEEAENQQGNITPGK